MSEGDEEIGDDWAAAMSEQAGDSSADWGEAMKEQSAGVTSAEFPNLGEQQKRREYGGSSGEVKLDVILDVPVTLSLEIGRTKINIRNLLQLNQGSVVELDRFAGEPMDVLVNGTLVAHGEVVVVNDKFGIRLTDIISPSERVRKLG
jgi:flagellar motor switch protein FliN/FliY